jgi:hypothetical protein
MVDDTPLLPGLSPVADKAVVARFDGGRLSSEGGLLALREIERRVGLAERPAACLIDPRMPERVRHQLAEIIRFRMLMIADVAQRHWWCPTSHRWYGVDRTPHPGGAAPLAELALYSRPCTQRPPMARDRTPS